MSSIKNFPLAVYQLFCEYNNWIITEWDLRSDTFGVSKKWVDTFGYIPEEANFSHTVFHTPFIHPDDRHIIQEYFSKVKQANIVSGLQNNFETVNIRFVNMLNEYSLCRMHLLTLFSQLNHPITILGFISSINAEDEAPTAAATAKADEANTAEAAAHNIAAAQPDNTVEEPTAAEADTGAFTAEAFHSAYNSVDQWLYIIDRENHEIKFMNRALISHLGYDSTGRKCYRSFYQRSQPCESCPLAVLSLDTRKAQKETFNKLTRQWLKITASRLPQIADYDAGLIQINDITEKKELEYMPTL